MLLEIVHARAKAKRATLTKSVSKANVSNNVMDSSPPGTEAGNNAKDCARRVKIPG